MRIKELDFIDAIDVLQTVLDEIKENGEEWVSELFGEDFDEIEEFEEIAFDDLVEIIDSLDCRLLSKLATFIDAKLEYEFQKKRLIDIDD